MFGAAAVYGAVTGRSLATLGGSAESAAQVPIQVRKQRTHTLRDLAARKNLEFRQRMAGRELSVVTLDRGALSENYLKVTLAKAREANRIETIRIGGVLGDG
jgi:tRNA A37 methylthiotransferase MiaB